MSQQKDHSIITNLSKRIYKFGLGMMVLFSLAAVFSTLQSYFSVKSVYKESIEPTIETTAIKTKLEELSFELTRYLKLSVKTKDLDKILSNLPSSVRVEDDKSDFTELQRKTITQNVKEIDLLVLDIIDKYGTYNFKDEIKQLASNWNIFKAKYPNQIEKIMYSQDEIMTIQRDIAGLKLGVTNIEKHLNKIALDQIEMVRYKSILFILVFLGAMVFGILASYRLNSGVLSEIEILQDEFKKTHTHITAMIDSINQGFLMFNRNAHILETFTKSCVDLFGISPSGRLINEVLQIKSDEKGNFERWIRFIFEKTIPFDSLKDLGPRKLEFGKIGDRGYRYIDLDYALYEVEDEVQAVILIATDKTKEKIAEHKLMQRDEKIEIIDKVVKNQRDYINGLGEIEVILKELSDLSQFTESDLKTLVPRALHTIKGLAGTMGIQSLQKASHEIEEQVNDLFESNIKKAIRDTKKLYEQKLYPVYIQFKETYKDFLGPELIDGRRRLTIFKDELEHELKRLSLEQNNYFQDRFIRTNITDSLKEITFGLERRAAYQSKAIAPPEFINKARKIDPEKYKSLFATFVHLYNNCVDHGIELPSEREASEKPAEGSIQTSCSEVGENFFIVIQDDGAGVNTEVLRNKISEKFPETIDKPDHEVLQYLFKPNTSTKDVANSFSGRGVGLDATKQAIESWGGSIEMFSEQGKGVRFEILLQAK